VGNTVHSYLRKFVDYILPVTAVELPVKPYISLVWIGEITTSNMNRITSTHLKDLMVINQFLCLWKIGEDGEVIETE